MLVQEQSILNVELVVAVRSHTRQSRCPDLLGQGNPCAVVFPASRI
jgi:hypothetical protein